MKRNHDSQSDSDEEIVYQPEAGPSSIPYSSPPPDRIRPPPPPIQHLAPRFNPTAAPFLPARPSSQASRRVRPRLDMPSNVPLDTLPDLEEGDEWQMVDSIWCFPLLGWETISFFDVVNRNFNEYVVGVSANQIIVGVPDLDSFKLTKEVAKPEEEEDAGELEWVRALYRYYRPAGMIVSGNYYPRISADIQLHMVIVATDRQTSSPYIRITYGEKDSTNRALGLVSYSLPQCSYLLLEAVADLTASNDLEERWSAHDDHCGSRQDQERSRRLGKCHPSCTASVSE